MGRIMSLRKEYDRPMIVNSGYRCPKHNNNVSDTGFHGPHTMGVALDIRVAGSDQFDFVRLAINHGFRRFGMRQHGPWNLRFVHIDGLFGENYPRVFWTYN